MNNLKKALMSMIADTHHADVVSSKRVIILLAFIFCSIAFFANMFYGKKIDQFIYETMAWIVLGGIGSTAIEKFSNKQNTSNSN